jgi:hypothetical protein
MKKLIALSLLVFTVACKPATTQECQAMIEVAKAEIEGKVEPVKTNIAKDTKITSLGDLYPPPNYGGCKDCSLIVRRMAMSITEEPHLWKTDGFYLTRVDGPSVWIANEDYAIGIGPTKGTTTRLDDRSGPEMRLLWKAFKHWQELELIKGNLSATR